MSEETPELLFPLLSAMPDAVTVVESDGRFSFVNAAAARAMGYATVAEIQSAAPADLVARYDLLDEEGRPVSPEQMPSAIARRDCRPAEAVVRFRLRGTSDEHWALVSSTPLVDQAGGTRVLNVFRDVTAQRRTQQALRFLAEASALLNESLDFEQTLHAVARAAVPVVADWCAVDLLEPGGAIKRVAVAHPDPAKMRLAEELTERWPPDPREKHGLHEVLRSGGPQTMEEIPPGLFERAARDPEHLRVLRELAMFSYMIVPLKARGKTLGALTFVSAESRRRLGRSDLDLAESLASRAAVALDNARLFEDLRRSNERLGVALEAGRLGSWEWDLHQRRLLWSPGLERIHGIEPGSFAGTFEAFQADLHPEDRARVVAHVESVLAEKQRDFQVTYRIVRPDGEVRWLEGRALAAYDPAGKPLRLTGVCSDVTERRETEELARKLDGERSARLQEAESASRAREEILGIVSHDLRNPLGVIAFANATLRKPEQTEHSRLRQLDQIDRAVTRMNRLITDLMDVTRIDSGRLEVRCGPQEVGPLLADALEAHRGVAEEKSISLRLQQHDGSARVWADRERVLQIFSNLIGNAIKFSPEGGSVTVSAAPCAAEITFSVADEGEGIRAEDLPHVFERFWQADRSARQGAGLGLAIARGLVEAHGGRLWVESARGRGSIFHFTLAAGGLRVLPAVAGAPPAESAS